MFDDSMSQRGHTHTHNDCLLDLRECRHSAERDCDGEKRAGVGGRLLTSLIGRGASDQQHYHLEWERRTVIAGAHPSFTRVAQMPFMYATNSSRRVHPMTCVRMSTRVIRPDASGTRRFAPDDCSRIQQNADVSFLVRSTRIARVSSAQGQGPTGLTCSSRRAARYISICGGEEVNERADGTMKSNYMKYSSSTRSIMSDLIPLRHGVVARNEWLMVFNSHSINKLDGRIASARLTTGILPGID